MKFTETKLKGAFILELEERSDERGFFARAFCSKEFADHGLNPHVLQANTSFNHKKGTLRGMHYQVPPAVETKFIRCTRGGIHDIIVDLRPGSPTYLEHIAVELTADNRKMLYIPAMFGHGFQTLADQAEVFYQVGEMYTPGCERGIRYNDPALGLKWPLPVSVISSKDAAWPDFVPETAEVAK